MTSTPLSTPRALRPAPLALATLLTLAALAPAAAQIPDISNVPLGTTSTTTAKPNIMFILDDSGSMNWEYMPDEMSNSGRYGYWSSQCNGVAFNPDPAVSYAPPLRVDANGVITSYPNVSLTAAPLDGFASNSGTANLSGNYFYRYTGSQPALSWSYTSAGNVNTSTTFYTECQTAIGNNAPFTRVDVSTLSASDQQRYANWYSYYRKRVLTMRTAAGRAFAELSDAYRVGFTKISDTGVTSNNFLPPSDFDVGQKTSFYNLLYTSGTGGFTPLRGALSKVGRYYGGVLTRPNSPNPIQYSCQRNYAILSSDGYWNDNSETSSYTALDLTGQLVGNQDGAELRPMKDGSSTRITRVRTEESGEQTVSDTAMRMTVLGRRNVVGTTLGEGRCDNDEYLVTRTGTGSASCSVDWTRTTTAIRTTITRTTTVIVDGVAGTPSVAVSNRNESTSTPAAPSSCPAANWVLNNPTTTTRCRTADQLRTDGLTVGGTTFTTTSTPTTTTGTTTPVSSTPIASDNTVETTTTSTGDSNTLADVAQYYWQTDLRSELDNNVPASGDDTARHQHMSTFTIGLGLKGTLNYDRNYMSQRSGDFADIRSGAKNWPVPSGTTGGNENATHIDDLWHAAVNGRGLYFSASNPDQLDDAISTTLSAIRRVTESGAAAAASTLTPVSGDDWVFLPSFTTVSWTGDLRAFKFGFTDTGEVIAPDTTAGNEIWSAGRQLSSRSSARRVLFNNAGTLAAFNHANLSAAGKSAAFDNRCSRALGSENLAQCASLTPAAAAKVTGANLVDYLAGSSSLYLNATNADDQVFRTRDSLLGDFVNASPVYVGKPPFRYADSGYAAFVSANSGRAKMVYAASNDGMLHAFKVGTGRGDPNGGVEAWAFVPSGVIDQMWRLADRDYDHRYYVDATPNVADVYDATAGRWRTILVGGLGAGGRSYYALDITDPDNPALLWEFSNANLGYTFGNPVVTKNAAGNWIVIVGSGTNNVNGGDGVGRLFVLNAITGALIDTLSTGVGSSSAPSNLGRINAWVVSDTDNTALRVYAGDMLGNLWRFDHDDQIAPAGKEATLLGRAETAGGVAQPIVGRPVLSEETINGVATPIISFGTGRLLNSADLGNTTLQTIYAVKDKLAATGLGVLRSTGAQLVPQILNGSRATPTVTPVDWVTQNGWYIDLTASSKERVYLDGVQLSSGVLAFASTVPTSDACSQGGQSFLYQVDLRGGQVLGTTNFANMIVGLNRIMSNNGKVSAIVTTQDQKTTLTGASGGGTGGVNTLRRSSWRELVD